MKLPVLIVAFAGFITAASPTQAATINYNTTGSSLSCGVVAGCIQNTTNSVTKGGLTLTYNSGSGSGVLTPSIVNLGNFVSTGTGASVNFTGLLLTINVNSTPPGVGGTLQSATVSGSISTSNSNAFVAFGPNNTTTTFGSGPGVTVTSGVQSFTYQVLNTRLGIQAPTVGNPIGETSIQGGVAEASIFANGFEN
jgi:hypothetical protein